MALIDHHIEGDSGIPEAIDYVVDEVGSVSAAMIAVLVGDHCELPPAVLRTRAGEEGLGVPLLYRMVTCGVLPFMLDTQYRMHPGIAMFPSDLYCGGKLVNGVSLPGRRPCAGFPWPREEFPVAFVPIPHRIEIDDGVSKINEAEAAGHCV